MTSPLPSASPTRVLVVSTGNSRRSPIAEVIWNHWGGGDWEVHSAGLHPDESVDPLTRAVLAEWNLPAPNRPPQSIDDALEHPLDLLVTVGQQAREACHGLSIEHRLHWAVDQPEDGVASKQDPLEQLRQFRDRIASGIRTAMARPVRRTGSRPIMNDATRRDALELIRLALTEDIGSPDLATGFDITTDAVVPPEATAEAALISRERGIVSGLTISRLVIQHHAPDVHLRLDCQDGDPVEPGQSIAVLSGRARDILTIERTCLNFICRMSGIASLTRTFVDRIAESGAQVLDTRKNTPGWRRLEKYAVACGGGTNHRMGLYDAVMIKDNHLAFYRVSHPEADDPVADSVRLSRAWIDAHASRLPHGRATILQLEVDTLEQFERALETDCDIVLLDNMSTAQLCEAVELRNRHRGELLLEASGGVTLQTIAGIAATGVDRISVGALTHSAPNFDIGLDWLRRHSAPSG